MTNRRIVWFAAAGLAAAAFPAGSPADGFDAEKLVVEKRCDGCHAVDRPLLGPPYNAIAARHATNEKVMVDVLAQKIIEGGGGNWGLVPMVPNEHVSIEEARAIARWILSLQ